MMLSQQLSRASVGLLHARGDLYLKVSISPPIPKSNGGCSRRRSFGPSDRALLPELAPLEGANEEESRRGNAAHHASYRQLALREQIGLIASELVWSQLVRPFSKVFSKLLNGM
jgi:hypothetical protein